MGSDRGYSAELLITMPDGSLQSKVIKNSLLTSLPTSFTQVSIRKIVRQGAADGREKGEKTGRG
jgi:hypothetical protein